MKRSRFFSMLSAVAISLGCFAATDCDLHIMIVDSDNSDAPAEMSNIISTRLIQALSAEGMSAGDTYGQLYMSGRFTDTFKETVPGPPAQTAVTTLLTLYVADIFADKVFDSQTFELRGVGTSEQKAYLNALKQLNGKNKSFQSFVSRAKEKTIEYFDKNYRQLLDRARNAAETHDYEMALYYTTLIPQCSKGYGEAEKATLSYFKGYADYQGQMLLTKAKGVFAASPNADGASEAYALISRINPTSDSYGPAMKFADEMAHQTKEEYDFEVHKKYNDEISRDRAIIDAARQIGVAYGTGQKAQTTNILWK